MDEVGLRTEHGTVGLPPGGPGGGDAPVSGAGSEALGGEAANAHAAQAQAATTAASGPCTCRPAHGRAPHSAAAAIAAATTIPPRRHDRLIRLNTFASVCLRWYM